MRAHQLAGEIVTWIGLAGCTVMGVVFLARGIAEMFGTKRELPAPRPEHVGIWCDEEPRRRNGLASRYR